jgi:hypothetical protein
MEAQWPLNSSGLRPSAIARLLRSRMQTLERELACGRCAWGLARSHRDVAAMAVVKAEIRWTILRIRFLRKLALPGELE